jgi:hypothetical protein
MKQVAYELGVTAHAVAKSKYKIMENLNATLVRTQCRRDDG